MNSKTERKKEMEVNYRRNGKRYQSKRWNRFGWGKNHGYTKWWKKMAHKKMRRDWELKSVHLAVDVWFYDGL